jgi:hypothetical protein
MPIKAASGSTEHREDELFRETKLSLVAMGDLGFQYIAVYNRFQTR